MIELEKCIIITNNDRVRDKYSERAEVIFVESYKDVLIKTRDMVYDRHKLLTHPQAGSLKPNQTPYRSVMVYSERDKSDMDDIMLMEKAIETFDKFNDIKKTPKYEEKIANDYKTIDLSMIDNVIAKM